MDNYKTLDVAQAQGILLSRMKGTPVEVLRGELPWNDIPSSRSEASIPIEPRT